MTMTDTHRDLFILSQVPGIGTRRLRALVTHFGSAGAVARAPGRQLVAVEGIEQKTAALLTSFFRGSAAGAAEKFADEQLARLAKLGGRLLTVWERDYPSLLKKIYDPPPFLFVHGTLDESDNYSLAIVGTRSPTPYGIRLTDVFAKACATLGIPVVSGLARGIDTAAHTAAVRGHGRTIAVIGSGLDVIYPAENKGLAERIRTNGAILSEFPLGTKPDAVNFPRRNRIVSGMTLGTLVVETGVDGGAMITANMAVDQGREVFALPSPLVPGKPSGTNLLIKEGKAKLTETIDDILVELAPRLAPILPQGSTKRRAPSPDLNLFERQIVEALGDSPVSVEAITERTGLSPSDALVHLLSLEFKGIVKQMPGKMFLLL